MFFFEQEQPSPFKTIIEMIIGYFVERGKKTTSEEKTASIVKAVSIERSSLNESTPPQAEDNITNQTLVDCKLIHLTPAATSHAPNLGTIYDSLLQEETDKPVTTETTPNQIIHSKSLEKPQTANPSKRLLSQLSSRPREMMVTRTAQPVIVAGSKSKRTKSLRISHKAKVRVEQDTTDPQSPTKSIPTTSKFAEVVSKQEGLIREDVKPATVDSMVNRSLPTVEQTKQV